MRKAYLLLLAVLACLTTYSQTRFIDFNYYGGANSNDLTNNFEEISGSEQHQGSGITGGSWRFNQQGAGAAYKTKLKFKTGPLVVHISLYFKYHSGGGSGDGEAIRVALWAPDPIYPTLWRGDEVYFAFDRMSNGPYSTISNSSAISYSSSISSGPFIHDHWYKMDMSLWRIPGVRDSLRAMIGLQDYGLSGTGTPVQVHSNDANHLNVTAAVFTNVDSLKLIISADHRFGVRLIDNINIDGPAFLSVETPEASYPFSIYPTAIDDIFTVRLSGLAFSEEAWVVVTDLMGRQVLNKPMVKGQEIISAGHLASGPYIILLHYKGQIYPVRVVKK